MFIAFTRVGVSREAVSLVCGHKWEALQWCEAMEESVLFINTAQRLPLNYTTRQRLQLHYLHHWQQPDFSMKGSEGLTAPEKHQEHLLCQHHIPTPLNIIHLSLFTSNELIIIPRNG